MQQPQPQPQQQQSINLLHLSIKHASPDHVQTAILQHAATVPQLLSQPFHSVTPLVRALERGNNVVTAIVLDAVLKQEHRAHPLWYEAVYGTSESVQLLLQHGASDSSQLASALQGAVEADRFKTVQLMMQHHTGASAAEAVVAALMLAVTLGRYEIAEWILQSSPTYCGTHQSRLLIMKALDSGRSAMIQLVLHYSSPIAVAYALQYGIAACPLRTLQTVLQCVGPNPEYTLHPPPYEAQATALHTAVTEPYREDRVLAVVQLLLDAHADPHARDATGRVPLMLAQHASVVQALCAAGSDPCAVDLGGRNALHWACADHQGSRVVEELVQAGTSLWQKDAFDCLPVDTAALVGNRAAEALLLEHMRFATC